MPDNSHGPAHHRTLRAAAIGHARFGPPTTRLRHPGHHGGTADHRAPDTAPPTTAQSPTAPNEHGEGTTTASAPDGYRLIGGDGGVFAFGGLDFHGSLGGSRLNAPVVAAS